MAHLIKDLAATHVGFDRPVLIDWIRCAIEIRSGLLAPDSLASLLDATELGKEATSKTRTKLNALVLQPRPQHSTFLARGIELVGKDPARRLPLFAWGASLVTYPFFAKVAEILGRLTAIQGECSAQELHRRISELYGDRKVCTHARKAITQSLADWNLLDRTADASRIVRRPALPVPPEMNAWMAEAFLRQTGRPVPVAAIPVHPSLFPFGFDASFQFTLSQSAFLELNHEGGQLIARIK